MHITVLLGASLAVQLAAAAVALALIRVTGRRLAWLLIAAAMSLMALRRGITLYHGALGKAAFPPDPQAELVSFFISLLMLAGVVLILPFFRSGRNAASQARESRRVLTTLISNLPGIAYRCRNDRNWTMEFVSDGCVELTGYRAEDFIDQRTVAYADLIHPEDRESVWQQVQAAVAEKRPFRLVYRITRADGREKWVWEQGRGVFDESGALQALEGFVTDISERQRVEEKLQFFQFAVDHTGDAVFWVRLDARFFYVNDAACRSLGYSREELEQLTVHDIDPDYPADRWPDTWQAIRRSAGGVGSLTFESRHRRRDGTIFPVEITASLVEFGKQEFICAFARDITDRKRAERSLQQARADLEQRVKERTKDLTEANLRLEREIAERKRTEHELRESSRKLVRMAEEMRTLLKHTRDFLYRHDTQGIFDYLSPAVEQITGYTVDEWRTHYTTYLTDHPVNEKVIAYTEETLRTGRESPPYLVEIFHMEGRRIMLEVNERPFFEDGRVAGIIGVARDVTERVRAQAEMQKAKEAAEAANRTKTVFLANVSHEIRTPITAMLGAAEHLSNAVADDATVRDPAEIILRNARHLLLLVEDLLDLSRAEAGRLEIRRDDCVLPELLSDVAALTRPLLHRPNVGFRIVCGTPVPEHIHTDATRLKQALLNLINNALKFTQEGHVEVRVSVDRDAAEPKLIFIVSDTGVGIPPQATERIFEPFTQVAPSSCDAHGGVGLGLPLARWIAEQLGGGLTLDRTSPKGTVFTLQVAAGPVDTVQWMTPADIRMHPRPAPGGAAVREAPLMEGAVLLAEDFRDTRVVMERALLAHGVSVTAVENGFDAVEAAGRQSFDLIIMDIRMPGLDGVAAAGELRRRGCLAPIVALTASIAKSDQQRLLDAGFDDLWIKPMGLDHLIESAAAYLQTRTVTDDRKSTTREPQRRENRLRLAEARREFARSLPARVEAIRRFVERGELEGAYEELHKLVGAAGVHGFGSVSLEAARLLAMCRETTVATEPDPFRLLAQQADQCARADGAPSPSTPQERSGRPHPEDS